MDFSARAASARKPGNMGYICGLFKIKYLPHASGNKMRANRVMTIDLTIDGVNYFNKNK